MENTINILPDVQLPILVASYCLYYFVVVVVYTDQAIIA